MENWAGALTNLKQVAEISDFENGIVPGRRNAVKSVRALR
jgi:hypothetical protein